MVLSILIMTGLVGPIVNFTHKSTRYTKKYYRRNLERSKVEAELRVLACVHSSKNVSGLINLLHISNATRKFPITVFAVHLVELTGRASAMLIFHDKTRTTNVIGNEINPIKTDAGNGGGDDDDDEIFAATFEKEKEMLLDDDYINEFRFRTMHNQSISYIEKQVNSGDQIVSIIRSTYNDFDLYIVGRGHGMQSPLTVGLSDWSNCPELGLIGETLGAADFLPSGSVLVMQQSTPPPSAPKKIVSSARKKEVFKNSGQPSAVPFVNHRKADDYY
ncbi:hypothetical protein SCA6_015470 [Theobroma cacao]